MATKLNGLSPDLIIHPGETIKELLEERKMTQDELALRVDYSAKHISEVISGKKAISARLANALEYVFGISTEFWINLQGIYDKNILELEKLNNIEEAEFNILDELKDIVKYCENNGIITKGLNKSLTLLNMRKFLNVNNLEIVKDLPLVQVAFRASTKTKVNSNVLYAWQKICEYLTDKVVITKKFDRKLLKEKYDEIKSTMFLEPNEMIIELKRIFLDCGIVFEVVPNFVGAPVQGFIQKRNDKVILCLTIRYSYADVFWFTLFHEIEHLENVEFNDQYVDFTFKDDEMEQNADLFARNILIDEKDYELFLKSANFSKKAIELFAKSQNVKPGIVIGRIQNDTNDYTFMASGREKYKWVNEL